MTYQNILIDEDDTIFDFPAAEEEAFKALLKKLHVAYTPVLYEKYTDYNRRLWNQINEGKLTRSAMQKRRFADFFQQECHLTIKNNEQLISTYQHGLASSHVFKIHAQETIVSLKKAGYHLAVISNGLTSTEEKRLTDSEIINDFDHVFISQKMGVMKPSKAYFAQIFAKSGWQPEKTIVIGDDLLSDIMGAAKYGLDSIWYNQHHIMNMTAVHPTFVCDDWAAIPALLN